MKQLISKLTSRKFLLSAISMLAGIAALCGVDQSVVDIIAGAAMTVLPAIVYCITEGRIDAASVKAAQDAVVDAAKSLGVEPSVQTLIHAAGDMIAAVGEEPSDAE